MNKGNSVKARSLLLLPAAAALVVGAHTAYAVVTAHSIVSAFFDPAQTATFPSLVPQEDLAYAATRRFFASEAR